MQSASTARGDECGGLMAWGGVSNSGSTGCAERGPRKASSYHGMGFEGRQAVLGSAMREAMGVRPSSGMWGE